MKRKYYPRSYKRLYLQDRDIEIIGYCIEQKFLTVDQISKRFFKMTAGSKDPNQAAYKRVLILQKFGMLAIKSLLTGERVVMATEVGAGELANRKIESLDPVVTVDYRYFEHDRRVNDVRVVLENGDVVHGWESDRWLKARFSNSTRVPDAMFKLVNGQAGVLEVEIAKKAKRRYEMIFEDYARKRYGEIDLVFYVCNTMRQIETLASMTADYRWIYFALYDQLMRDGQETTFANTHENFQLKELQEWPAKPQMKI